MIPTSSPTHIIRQSPGTSANIQCMGDKDRGRSFGCFALCLLGMMVGGQAPSSFLSEQDGVMKSEFIFLHEVAKFSTTRDKRMCNTLWALIESTCRINWSRNGLEDVQQISLGAD